MAAEESGAKIVAPILGHGLRIVLGSTAEVVCWHVFCEDHVQVVITEKSTRDEACNSRNVDRTASVCLYCVRGFPSETRMVEILNEQHERII